MAKLNSLLTLTTSWNNLQDWLQTFLAQQQPASTPAFDPHHDGDGHSGEDHGYSDVVLQPDGRGQVSTAPGQGLQRRFGNLQQEGRLADGVAPDSTSLGSRPVISAADTFLLESNPNASKTIFLDFDGRSLSGTAWNSTNLANGWAPAFSTDTDPTTFSSSELAIIQEVFFRIAADYAPFDVNVTLKEPSAAKITRSSSTDTEYGTVSLFSSIADQLGYSGAGGVAYVGIFDNTSDIYKPALVFPSKLGNNAKNMAEAGSHEIGHNLNLSHDGTSTTGYYTGQGSAPGWAPIMGVGYYKNLVQFSRGEYADANQTQNDFDLITREGVSYYLDTEGDTIATATPLTFSRDRNNDGIGDWASIVGSIDLRSSTGLTGSGTAFGDLDVYGFYLPAAGDLNVNVGNGLVYNVGANKLFDFLPGGWGNLRADALLWDASGNVVVDWNTNNLVDVSNFAITGLNSGTYYLGVQGNPNSPDGESIWGSLGQYQLNLDYTPTGPVTPQSPTYALSAGAGSVNEGGSITYTISTTGVTAGTNLTWKLSGSTTAGIDANDLTSAMQGLVTVDSLGQASFSASLNADEALEGSETLIATLYDATGTTALGTPVSVTVNDTSKPVVVDPNQTKWGTAAGDAVTGGSGNDQIAGVPAVTSFSTELTNQIDVLTGLGGNDKFLLADGRGLFYRDTTTTSSGTSHYARITDFSSGDQIQLKSGSTYWLRAATINNVSGMGIYLNDSTGKGSKAGAWDSRDEFIGLVQVSDGSVLNLANTSQFLFV